jgi:hypothetical protein
MSTLYIIDLFVAGVETMRREGKRYFFARLQNVSVESLVILQDMYRGYGVVSRTPGGIVIHRLFSQPKVNGLQYHHPSSTVHPALSGSSTLTPS